MGADVIGLALVVRIVGAAVFTITGGGNGHIMATTQGRCFNGRQDVEACWADDRELYSILDTDYRYHGFSFTHHCHIGSSLVSTLVSLSAFSRSILIRCRRVSSQNSTMETNIAATA